MRVACLFLTLSTLLGCGYKGPLYLPEAKAPASKPGSVVSPAGVIPEPAIERPQPAEATPPPK